MTQLANAWLADAPGDDAPPPAPAPACTALAVPTGAARDVIPRVLPVTPIGVTDNERYVFLLADNAAKALTFQQLLDENALRKLCGGDAWLKFFFPRQVLARVDGRWVFVAVGIDTITAAEFLAALCIEKQIALGQAPARPPGRERVWHPFRPRTWLRAIVRFIATPAGGTP